MYFTDHDTFSQFVDDGIAAIPQEFRDRFDNLSFVVYDFPSPYQMQKMRVLNPFNMLGLYEGVPITKRNNYAGALPDKITLFKVPMEVRAVDEAHLRLIVKNTVWHEIGHHFGMNEAEVRQAERNRGHQY